MKAYLEAYFHYIKASEMPAGIGVHSYNGFGDVQGAVAVAYGVTHKPGVGDGVCLLGCEDAGGRDQLHAADGGVFGEFVASGGICVVHESRGEKPEDQPAWIRSRGN